MSSPATSLVIITPAPQYEPPYGVPALPYRHHLAPNPPRSPAKRTVDTVTPAAHKYALTTITMVLEVFNHRRTVKTLSPLASPHIIEQLTRLCAGPRKIHNAKLIRFQTQACPGGDLEITAIYQRGNRVHALAARMVFQQDKTNGLITALLTL